MSGRLETSLFVLQRLTAMILAPLVLIHLATIIYAVHGGLSAAEILSRTRGSLLWGGLYGLFVLAAGLHGSVGLRTVLREMTPVGLRGANTLSLLFLLAVLAFGLRAVEALV